MPYPNKQNNALLFAIYPELFLIHAANTLYIGAANSHLAQFTT